MTTMDYQGEHIRIKIRESAGGRSQLVVDYPREKQWQDVIVEVARTLMAADLEAGAKPEQFDES